MPYFDISMEVQNVDIVRQGLEDLTGEMKKVGRQRLYFLMLRARKNITQYPTDRAPKQKGLSTAARRWLWFAATRGIIDIPYRRTGRYKHAWKIIREETGYRLEAGGYYIQGMQIGYPAIFAVGGDPLGQRQAPMHQGRWPLAATVIQETFATAPDEVQEDIAYVIHKRGYDR